MIKYAIVGGVVVLVWLLSLVLSLPLWPAVLLTVLAAMVAAAIFAFTWYRNRRAASRLESALAMHASDSAQGIRPDLAASMQEMRTEFERAVSALRGSKVAGGGAAALYALPWYVIIGPPGAGKSTALRNSGLHFPYLSQGRGGAVQGLGGTRNCDWWFTNEAVLLDTAGRWSTHDEDREEWHSFLDLLRTHRPRKPLNGVLVAVSIADLVEAGPDGAMHVATKVRERIDEASSRLRMTLPVYLLVTKCDLLPGFIEAYEMLSAREREELWGFTAPVLEPPSDPVSWVDAQLGTLVSALEVRALHRATEIRRPEQMDAVLGLPEQVEAIRPALMSFVGGLLRDDIYQGAPTLRGVYMTSGTQEGRPFDRLVRGLADSLGLASARLSAPVTDPKSYFLREVFSSVVFQDADLASFSVGELRRRQWMRWGIAAAAVVISSILLLPSAVAWSHNRGLLDDLEGIAAELDERLAQAGVAPLSPDAFDPLAAQVQRLDEMEREGAPLSWGFGFYRGSDVLPSARAAYARAVRAGAVAPTHAQLLANLSTLVQQNPATGAEPSPSVHRAAFRGLRTHLRLSAPREPTQPALAPPATEELAASVGRQWAALVPTSQPDDPRYRRHAAAYADALATTPSLAFTRDARVTSEVRELLGRVNPVRIVLDQVIAQYDTDRYNLDLTTILGRRLRSMSARASVPGAFTKRAYDDGIRGMLMRSDRHLLADAWVLGPDQGTHGDAARQTAELRTEYFRRYSATWREFLRGIRVRPPDGQTQALSLLEDLTRGEPTPYAKLFVAVAENVRLEPEEAGPSEEEETDEAAGERLLSTVRSALADDSSLDVDKEETADDEGRFSVGPEAVQRAFDPFVRFGVGADGTPSGTQLATYEEQILFVRDALQTQLEDPAAAEGFMERIQSARTTVTGLISEQPIGWRPVFENLLWAPIDGASMSFSSAQAAGTGRSWCNDVATPFSQTLRGRYPFESRGRDASLEDFAAFYAPNGGMLWTFYDDRLANIMPRRGRHFSFGSRLGQAASHVYSSGLPRFLERSQDISDTFFGRGASQPSLDLDVRLHPAGRVAVQRLRIGGRQLEYMNGPEQWQRIQWPGPQPGQGAVFEVRGAGGLHGRIEAEGEWGLLRLLERGQVRSSGDGRSLSVTWSFPGQGVSIAAEIRTTRAVPALSGRGNGSGFTRIFQATGASAPRNIIPGRSLCGS